MMNWNWRGWKRSWPDRGTIPSFAWRDWGKPQHASVRIPDVSGEIRTSYKSKALPLDQPVRCHLSDLNVCSLDTAFRPCPATQALVSARSVLRSFFLLQLGLPSWNFPVKVVYPFLFVHPCYMPCHLTFLYLITIAVWGQIKICEILIICCHFK
jgi:hypothetical protein